MTRYVLYHLIIIAISLGTVNLSLADTVDIVHEVALERKAPSFDFFGTIDHNEGCRIDFFHYFYESFVLIIINNNK